ncbi:MAG: DUF3105 domain-containing protein [Chloroflexi bacterium]|nr:DUF3105 domain-containing protein [Chloroflexota bacterium]
MVSRILPAAFLTALSLMLPATAAEAQMAEGTGNEELFQFDANHPAYKDIQREKSLGREHIEGPVDYGSEFPTSGPHDPSPVRPGFYDAPQRTERLVHSLEHGSIIIYYDKPSDATMDLIRSWTDKFPGAWDGVIAVPHENLGERIVLTAWRHRLELPKMDVRASFFIDAFRGRGPEQRVR